MPSFYFLPLLAALLPAIPILAQTTSPQPHEAKPDYSKEAFVVEEDAGEVTFQDDGTSTRKLNTRVRIQSDAGVQQFAVLTFSYGELKRDGRHRQGARAQARWNGN